MLCNSSWKEIVRYLLTPGKEGTKHQKRFCSCLVYWVNKFPYWTIGSSPEAEPPRSLFEPNASQEGRGLAGGHLKVFWASWVSPLPPWWMSIMTFWGSPMCHDCCVTLLQHGNGLSKQGGGRGEGWWGCSPTVSYHYIYCYSIHAMTCL